MAKITPKLIKDVSHSIIEAFLDNHEDDFYAWITDIAIDRNLDPSDLGEAVADYLSKMK